MSGRLWELDDEELVRACRSGDLAAFEGLVLRHQKVMLNLAYRMLGNREEACEVVQDAFVAAYKALPSFRGEARFSTWVASITLNHARNALARVRSRSRHEAYSLDGVPVDEARPRPEPASTDPSALERLQDEALRRRVEACIQALPRDFREVLVLRDMQDRPYDEIGAQLKVREGTVKSRLFRAREGLRDCLKRALGVP